MFRTSVSQPEEGHAGVSAVEVGQDELPILGNALLSVVLREQLFARTVTIDQKAKRDYARKDRRGNCLLSHEHTVVAK